MVKYFTSMTHIHRTILKNPYKGYRHLAQLWYNYNKTIYPHLTRIDMYRIEGGVIGPCVSSVSEDGLGEDKLTLDDRLTGLLILIDDGIVDNIIKGFF